MRVLATIPIKTSIREIFTFQGQISSDRPIISTAVNLDSRTSILTGSVKIYCHAIDLGRGKWLL